MQLLHNGQLRSTILSAKYADKVTFIYHHKFTESKMRKRFLSTLHLIDRYSDPRVAKIIGQHLEALVRAELRAQMFQIKGQHTNQYQEKKWTKTGHNLDFIAEHRSGRLTIGVEVKNTLSTPEREEVQAKIDLCNHLNLVPVFATRWMKPYVKLISDQGGFSWFFKTQIYPLGFENLTQTIWRKLQLPVKVRTDLPQKSVEVFSNWVTRNTSSITP
jgi:hypothetical protein